MSVVRNPKTISARFAERSFVRLAYDADRGRRFWRLLGAPSAFPSRRCLPLGNSPRHSARNYCTDSLTHPQIIELRIEVIGRKRPLRLQNCVIGRENWLRRGDFLPWHSGTAILAPCRSNLLRCERFLPLFRLE